MSQYHLILVEFEFPLLVICCIIHNILDRKLQIIWDFPPIVISAAISKNTLDRPLFNTETVTSDKSGKKTVLLGLPSHGQIGRFSYLISPPSSGTLPEIHRKSAGISSQSSWDG